jgi:uncharacterized protein
MKIQIQHIPTEGTTLAYSKEAKQFPVLKALMEEGGCRFQGPLSIELTVVPERELFKVSGLVAIDVLMECSRCLAEISSRLSRGFTLRFSKEIPQDLHGSDTQEVELTADQIGLIFFRGDEIDFKDTVQEQVVLALPYKPLCHEACKGLCPRCGVDLNKETCVCTSEGSDGSPFTVLQNLDLRPRKQGKRHTKK